MDRYISVFSRRLKMASSMRSSMLARKRIAEPDAVCTIKTPVGIFGVFLRRISPSRESHVVALYQTQEHTAKENLEALHRTWKAVCTIKTPVGIFGVFQLEWFLKDRIRKEAARRWVGFLVLILGLIALDIFIWYNIIFKTRKKPETVFLFPPSSISPLDLI